MLSPAFYFAGCKNCANMCPKTFSLEDDYGRARAVQQGVSYHLFWNVDRQEHLEGSCAVLNLLEGVMRDHIGRQGMPCYFFWDMQWASTSVRRG